MKDHFKSSLTFSLASNETNYYVSVLLSLTNFHFIHTMFIKHCMNEPIELVQFS